MEQPVGRELFGESLGVAPQLQPLQGMLPRPSTDICPKELTRDVRGFFNSLLGSLPLPPKKETKTNWPADTAALWG